MYQIQYSEVVFQILKSFISYTAGRMATYHQTKQCATWVQQWRFVNEYPVIDFLAALLIQQNFMWNHYTCVHNLNRQLYDKVLEILKFYLTGAGGVGGGVDNLCVVSTKCAAPFVMFNSLKKKSKFSKWKVSFKFWTAPIVFERSNFVFETSYLYDNFSAIFH